MTINSQHTAGTFPWKLHRITVDPASKMLSPEIDWQDKRFKDDPRVKIQLDKNLSLKKSSISTPNTGNRLPSVKMDNPQAQNKRQQWNSEDDDPFHKQPKKQTPTNRPWSNTHQSINKPPQHRLKDKTNGYNLNSDRNKLYIPTTDSLHSEPTNSYLKSSSTEVSSKDSTAPDSSLPFFASALSQSDKKIVAKLESQDCQQSAVSSTKLDISSGSKRIVKQDYRNDSRFKKHVKKRPRLDNPVPFITPTDPAPIMDYRSVTINSQH